MISGKSILVRPVEREDLEKIYDWSNDFEIKGISSFSINFISKDEIAQRIEENNKPHEAIEFAIVEKVNKKIIGECALKDIDYENKKSLCSIYIGDKESMDKGYGTEALNLIMKFAFSELGLNRIGMWVFDFNKRALRCFKKSGMKVEGIMRDGVYRDGRYHDVYFMGILKREYQEMADRGDDK